MHKLQLYSIDAISNFKELSYQVLPNQKVDYELIIEYWDDILRLVTTIKLGYEKASVLLRRLNRTGDPVLFPPESLVQSAERIG
ncbi:Tn3 family transposase [Dyadobacter arcticus]|uniref:Tn3 family transposase n=1 Tax=Dyadobacter arcticus TaxID=1078754 RepID=UPI00142348E9